MTAAAALSYVLMKKRDDKLSVRTLAADPPEWSPTSVDYYYWFIGSFALRQIGDRSWRERAAELLRAHQNADGSWDPIDLWSPVGGRV